MARDERHIDLIKEQIENLLADLARLTGDPEEVLLYVTGIRERMQRELGLG